MSRLFGHLSTEFLESRLLNTWHHMNVTRRMVPILFGTLTVGFCALYAPIGADLWRAWLRDGNYSHGPLIVLAMGYVVWTRRRRLADRPVAPATAGLLLVVISLALMLVGTAGVELFTMRVSAVGVIAGAIVYLAGWGWLRELAFPLALTALIIPIPPVIFYQLAFPLQLLATRLGVFVLQLVDVPVLREGNVIRLPHTALEVTEACSGLRSLVSLLSLAVLYGYFRCRNAVAHVAVALSAIPIAIVANGGRIAGTGIAAHFFGPSAATGFFHAFSGWVVFAASALMLFGAARAIVAAGRVVPGIRGPQAVSS
jgi:exosortase